MLLAYASVKWWKIFGPDQCAGINRFVAIFAVPLLSFEFISRIDPYNMDLLFVAADSLSKILILSFLASWARLSSKGSIDWVITLFSLATLPNTLVMGIPLVKAMYGDDKESLMIQAVVLQCIIWYTMLLFLFEYRAARLAVMKGFNTGSESGRRDKVEEIESGMREKLEESQKGEDEVVHVMVAKNSNSPSHSSNRVAPHLASTDDDGKELHMFVWPCGCCNSEAVCHQSIQVCSKEEKRKKEEGLVSVQEASMSVEMVKMIMKMVWFKLLANPNTYASLLGLAWALVSCKWNVKKPLILENSVTILSNAGLGMAMFSLGLFMALQPRIIACGTRLAAYGMLIRFFLGPAIMAVASTGVGLRGPILRVAIVQAALPQGIVPFVFAREYNLHPDVLSTAVIFGMIVSLPITVLYYVFLGL
ncbi:hypothetical protein AMTR_s00013p00242590 [Amborella trichopoda]|uniref:Auxin efflux carrier component n=2 Tax=Amborella trichopoda TaxID=13333 RepID=W1PRZ0_AMBTC|nr:hypothetical protein AMTR_s00013p00242590 [Amborella trichopoda]